MTAAIARMEKAQDRRLPDFPLPTDDPWYESHEDLDAIKPGTLLDHRPIEFRARFTYGVTARAWQLRYRSTDTAGRSISAVATLMVPDRAWAGAVPRPLVSYQAAIDSLGPKADPSYTLRRGNQRESSLMALGLRRGWAFVTADYTGPRRACFAGLIAGRIALDGIRAALQLEAAGYRPTRQLLCGGIPAADRPPRGQLTSTRPLLKFPFPRPEVTASKSSRHARPTRRRSLSRPRRRE